MKKRILRQLQDNAVLYTIVAVAIVGFGGYNLFFKGSGPEAQTLVVHPAEFLQQVSVSGKVVAAQDVDLGFSQSGRVTYVRGDVGARVAAGQLLAEIENADIRANISQRQAVLASQEAKLASLREGTRSEDIAVAQATVDGAVSALDQANQSIINAISDAYAKADDAIHNKFDQFINNPRSATPQLAFTTSASQLTIDIPAKRVSVEQMLVDWQGAIFKLHTASDLPAAAAQAQTNLAVIVALLADTSAALARAVPTASVSQTTINTYTSDIATARTTINTSIAAINTALTTQKAAVSTLDSARKNLALKKAGSTPADIAAQAAQVAAAQADVENAQAQLSKTRIVAPFSGVITKMDTKVGQIVSPNTPEISIIGGGAFQVESFIPESNVALIKVSNSATVTLDAYGESVPFEAKLVSIDPAETVRDGVSTYRAVLQFISQDPRIKSGMTAGVVITTQKKEGVLAVPQGVVIERDGAYFVPIKEGETTTERQVTTGETSSLGHIEILSGLNDGDTVILPVSE